MNSIINGRRAVRPAQGKLVVFTPGLGAVATTFIAGVLLARRGLGSPIGSLTQMGSLPHQEGPTKGESLASELGLAALKDLTFAAWDIFPENALEAARCAGVLEEKHLAPIEEELRAIVPMPGAFDPHYVKRLNGTHVKPESNKQQLVEALRKDIRNVIRTTGANRAVAVWCGSTEIHNPPSEVHATIESFEKGLVESNEKISPSQLYSWALLKEGVPIANGSPNFLLDFPAAEQLAKERSVPVAGKDFKTGQTWFKTVLAPGIRERALGVRGWFSTNILGNRDGEVLDDPDSFRSKEVSKLGVLESILNSDRSPELYGDVFHKVRIEYYQPRGDAKEGWDNIDLFGWLGYPMQLKVNFLCRDSILAAPIVLDLALLLDLASRANLSGPQEWLGFYWKCPTVADGIRPDHDLFAQARHLYEVLNRLHAQTSVIRVH